MEETKNPSETTGAENNGTQTEKITSTSATQEDYEARIKALEEAKAKATEEAANYKIAYLKAKNKDDDYDYSNETEDERIARIVQEKLAETKVAQINQEKEALLEKIIQENKELKLAQLNKKDTTTAQGSHTESQPVKDTLVTPEQLEDFKKRGWTDKDVERYKKNLRRYGVQ